MEFHSIHCIGLVLVPTSSFFQYAELASRGDFSHTDIVTALTANHGDADAAYSDLNKSELKPFLMRIWGPAVGSENESGNVGALKEVARGEGK